MRITKIAVLGAGVMGAQIAAHCANAGFDVYLYDLPSEGKDRNALINKAIHTLATLMPTPLATSDTKSLIHAKNYADDLELLGTCELVIEAIAERLDLKQSLFHQITPYLNDQCIVVTNSSGLSMEKLSASFPERYRERFCGVHFFNPPRYMHLAELIPAPSTSPELLNELETWLTRFLGKGVIRAKDTPNFIANRIGVFSLLATIYHAERFGLSIDEVDAITGVMLNRPKSATYRTLDVVGLDTMKHVVRTMKDALPDDPWNKFFALPEWMEALISQGHLGQKTGVGLYRKVGKTIEVYDVKTAAYGVSEAVAADELKTIFKAPEGTRMQLLFESEHPQARFLSAYFTDLLHYSAYHLHDIAHAPRDVDEAMQWGFGWKKGPFEIWQIAGVQALLEKIQGKISAHESLSQVAMPTWITDIDTFYSTTTKQHTLPVYARQISQTGPVVYENSGVVLTTIEDVAVVSFKTKANAVTEAVLEGMQEALHLAESRYQGLIIHQSNPALFSAGADLKMVSECVSRGETARLREIIAQFQRTVYALRYSSIPVVAALRGQALGGGCELLMHCDRVVAAFESYPGLVEVGVGLIPAGGGCKEWARRAANSDTQDEHLRLLQQYFEQTAMATVASSAKDAMRRGYLQSQDIILMHTDEVLYAALECVRSLNTLNYVPPVPSLFKAGGVDLQAKCQAKLVNLLEGEFMSPHDYFLSTQLLHVIGSGDLNYGELVSEAYLMQLELDAFMTLVETPQTQARIHHLLETGKPLRN